MPKSSSQTFTPGARRRDSSALAWISSPITAVSVSSRCRRCGWQAGVAQRSRRPRRGRSPLRSWRGETLTDTNSWSAAGCARCQRTASSQAARSTCGPMRFDQAALLGDIDEHRRRDHAHARGCCQRSSASAPTMRAVGEAVDRLVGEAQFAALPGAAQVLLQLHAALDRLVHRAAVEAVAVLAGDLGLVHGDVAVLHQHGRAGGVFREQGDADRRAEEHLAVLHRRSAGSSSSTSASASRLAAVRTSPSGRAALHQDDELVAAEAREHRAVAAEALDRVADAVGELHQHFVAGVVAEGVVDALEVVDVGEQQRQLAAGAAQLQQALVERSRGTPGGWPGRSAHRCRPCGGCRGRGARRCCSCGRTRAPGRRPRRRGWLTGVSVSKLPASIALRGIGQLPDRPHQRALQQPPAISAPSAEQRRAEQRRSSRRWRAAELVQARCAVGAARVLVGAASPPANSRRARRRGAGRRS